jgi:hypothetical protein
MLRPPVAAWGAWEGEGTKEAEKASFVVERLVPIGLLAGRERRLVSCSVQRGVE